MLLSFSKREKQGEEAGTSICLLPLFIRTKTRLFCFYSNCCFPCRKSLRKLDYVGAAPPLVEGGSVSDDPRRTGDSGASGTYCLRTQHLVDGTTPHVFPWTSVVDFSLSGETPAGMVSTSIVRPLLGFLGECLRHHYLKRRPVTCLY